MNDKTLTVTVVGRRCVYINDYRVAGSKPYVSENLPSWSFEADINDLRYAIGRRPSSANKALQARIETLQADNAKLREALAPFVNFWEWDLDKTGMRHSVSQYFAPDIFVRAVKTFHETGETFTHPDNQTPSE